MPTQWSQESCDLYTDPSSGARVAQLTSAAMISNNIYGEQPYTSADGKRIIIARCHDFCFDEAGSLLVHELDKLRITMVERSAVGARGVFNNAWSGLCYYWNAKRELVQISLTTLEKKVVYTEQDPKAVLVGSSVSPDQRYVIGQEKRLTGPGAPVFQIVRLDIQKGVREVIFEHPEICNPHLQYNPVTGKQILVQNNAGVRLKADGDTDAYQTVSCRLFVIDADGSNQRYLPAGPPVTIGGTGHECFVADTGRVLFSTHVNVSDFRHGWTHDSRFPTGNIFTAKPGDAKPTVFHAPEHFFNHVCASRCGRYFLADSMVGGGVFGANDRMRTPALVIGNIQSGKYRTLVEETMAVGGGNQCTHTHPYLTADNRWAIYNATPGGAIPQVFGAELAEGFLASLD